MTSTRDNAHARIVKRLLLLVVGMFGFGFAMVPIYNVFCDITGLNGKTNREAAVLAPMEIDYDRTITVEFVASLNQNMPWSFRPAVNKMQVHPGKAYTTNFYAENRADKTIVGHAVPSVAPNQAAQHFLKTECFCFTEQVFGPGEGRDMPVQFVVDPALSEDIGVVTLAYTFFDKGKLASVKAEDLDQNTIESLSQTN